VGCATLEDAFLNVAEKLDGIKCAGGEEAFGTGSEEATGSFLRADEPDCKSAPEPEKPRRVGKALFASHVRATFWKRAVHCRRELFAVSMGTVVAPLLFVIAGLAGTYFPFTTFRRLIAHTRLTFLFYNQRPRWRAPRWAIRFRKT